MITSATILVGLSLLLMAAAVVLLLKPWKPAAVPAFVAMALLQFTPCMGTSTWKMVMWGMATALVVGLRYYQPSGEPDGRNTGNVYVGLGSLAGALLGILVGREFIVVGTILGAFMGIMAYSRTPHGKWIKFPTSTFIQYFCAKGLPAIVAVSMMGICSEALLFYYKTVYFYL